jgi:hypothetical protein
MTRPDLTRSTISAYASEALCAEMLGRSRDWFKVNRPRLEREGFPKTDPLIGLTLRADIHAWLSRRSQMAQHVSGRDSPPMENLDAF